MSAGIKSIFALLFTLFGLAWTEFFIYMDNMGGVLEGGMICGCGLTLFGMYLSQHSKESK